MAEPTNKAPKCSVPGCDEPAVIELSKSRSAALPASNGVRPVTVIGRFCKKHAPGGD